VRADQAAHARLDVVVEELVGSGGDGNFYFFEGSFFVVASVLFGGFMFGFGVCEDLEVGEDAQDVLDCALDSGQGGVAYGEGVGAGEEEEVWEGGDGDAVVLLVR
jgi:hypothetical protein